MPPPGFLRLEVPWSVPAAIQWTMNWELDKQLECVSPGSEIVSTVSVCSREEFRALEGASC